MLLKLTFFIFFLIEIFSLTAGSPCSFTCLNQTETHSKSQPIYLNDTSHVILIVFEINCTSNGPIIYANVSISIENKRSVEINNSLPLNLFRFNISTNYLTFNLTLRGILLGYSKLLLHAEYLNETRNLFNYTDDLNIDLAVKRKTTVIDTIFTIVIIILVCIGTFLIGCRLVPQNLYANIRKPVPIIIGLFSQFLCLPLLAYGLAKLAKLDSSAAIGLLSTGTAPGGGASNMYTAMYGGDVDLSASMTFCSTILAFGTFPLWILLLGREFIDTHDVHFPWENMFVTLLSLVIPAAIGLLLRWKKPTIADRFTRYLRVITLFFITYILTFGIYTNLYIFKLIDYRTILVSAILPYSGFLIGFLMSIITKQSRQRLIAIFIESGLQNTGVAIFFLRLSLPEPDRDLAIIVPIFVAIAIPIPLLIIYGCISIHGYYKKRYGTNSLVTNINTEHDREDAQPRLRLQVDLSREKPRFVILPISVFDSLPIRVVQRINDDDDEQEEFLDKTIEDESNIGFDFNQCSPLWRVLLLVSSNSNTFDLIITLNHAIGDGTSGMAFFTSLLECLSEKSTLTFPLSDDRPLNELIPSKLPPLSSLILKIIEKMILPAILSKYFFPKTYWTGNTQRIADESSRTRLVSFKLPNDTLDLLHKKCRFERTTIHTALLSALLLSITEIFGKRNMQFSCNTAVNIRRFCQPIISNQQMGVFVSSADSYHYIPYRNNLIDLFWPLARQIKEQINHEIEHSVLPLVQTLKFISDWNQFLISQRNTLPNGYQHSVDISNILRWTFQTNDPSWKVLHGGFTQSANVIGSVFTASAVTVNGILKIYICFHEHDIEHFQQVKLMKDKMQQILIDAISL